MRHQGPTEVCIRATHTAESRFINQYLASVFCFIWALIYLLPFVITSFLWHPIKYALRAVSFARLVKTVHRCVTNMS